LFETVLVEVQAADNFVGNLLDTSYNFRITEGLTDVSPVLNAIALDGVVSLSWTIADNVMIDTWQLVRSEAQFPTAVTEGELIFEGADQLHQDLDVVNGTRYFYSIFLVRRFESGLPLYAPYAEVSSAEAKPRSIVSPVKASAEYRPQRGEFGSTARPVPGARLTGVFGDNGTRTSDGLTAKAGSSVRSPAQGSVKRIDSASTTDSQGAQAIQIETDKFIFVLDNITVDARIAVGVLVNAGELIGRSRGGEISFSIFRKPTGSFGLRVVRPSLFTLRAEDREGRG
jgi:hypothetical protein